MLRTCAVALAAAANRGAFGKGGKSTDDFVRAMKLFPTVSTVPIPFLICSNSVLLVKNFAAG
jgi:hypothetical protein